MSLPAFLLDGAKAYRWAQKNLDLSIDDEDDRVRERQEEEYESRAWSYVSFAQAAVRDGRLVVYRMICVPSQEQIELHNLGKAWSAQKRGAGCYGGIPHGGTTRELLVTGIVSTNDVDWQYGFASFMNYGESQWEVSMEADAPVSVIAVGTKTYDPPLAGNTGHASEEWRSSRAASMRRGRR